MDETFRKGLLEATVETWPTINFRKSWGMAKKRKSFFFQKNYILGSVKVQNKYFNTFFVKIDPGAPLKPPKSSFF